MPIPATITQQQLDLLKTASAIIYVIDDMSLHAAMQQSVPLDEDQLDALGERFSVGLKRWNNALDSKQPPTPVDVDRIALIADMLNRRYAAGVPRDAVGEIRLVVDDFRSAWHVLGTDLTHRTPERTRWEDLLHTVFGADSAVALPTPQPNSPSVQIGRLIANSLGLAGVFNHAFDAGVVPEAPVDALPAYAQSDPRANELPLMAKLQLELSITEGMLAAITPDRPNEEHHSHLVEYLAKRLDTAMDRIKDLIIPAGLAKFNSQLNDTAKVLAASRDILRTCVYGSEPELAGIAAQHAVERSIGTNIFLAICPNIPFFPIPTLELRIAITKPLYYVTKAAHEALGKIPIFGLLFFVMRIIGQFIDGIARFQVRVVQDLRKEGWLANKRTRARLIRRYLRYADRRATKPRIDALQRVLLGIVS